MKLRLLAALGLMLPGTIPAGCTAWSSDPSTRFGELKLGTTREQLENYYGPPTHWVLYYEPEGFAVFSYNHLLSFSTLGTPRSKPAWPVKEGMSVQEVRKIMGNPTKSCAGEYYTETFAHWFCYKNDILISKERQLPSF